MLKVIGILKQLYRSRYVCSIAYEYRKSVRWVNVLIKDRIA
jgi:hypothetical protein